MKSSKVLVYLMLSLSTVAFANTEAVPQFEKPSISSRLASIRTVIAENEGPFADEITDLDQGKISELRSELLAIKSDTTSTIPQKAHASALLNQLHQFEQVGVQPAKATEPADTTSTETAKM